MELEVKIYGLGLDYDAPPQRITGFTDIMGIGHKVSRAVREHIKTFPIGPHPMRRSLMVECQWVDGKGKEKKAKAKKAKKGKPAGDVPQE